MNGSKLQYSPWEIGKKRAKSKTNCNSLFYCMNWLNGPLGTPYPKWDKFGHFEPEKFTILTLSVGTFFHIFTFFSKTMPHTEKRYRYKKDREFNSA